MSSLPRLASALQPTLDVLGEDLEVVQILTQELGHAVQIEVEIAVDDDVPEAGDRAEAFTEIGGKDCGRDEGVDGIRVGRWIMAFAGCDVTGNVKCVLDAEQESPFYRPTPARVGAQ